MHDAGRDPIADANTAIRDYIRTIGGRIAPEHRGEYEQLVEVYFEAVAAQRDPEPLAA